MFRKSLLIAVALLLVAFMAEKPLAQESGTIQATATVQAGVTVTGNNNLIFGLVTPGINKAIARTVVGAAGEWHVSGTNGANVTVDFTLPVTLLHTDGVTTMPVGFAVGDAAWDNNAVGNQAVPAGGAINPNASNPTIPLGAAGDLWVWIGGTVMPPLAQTGGNYSADVVMTITYE
ncbi:MAG: hypothetical protein V3T31_01760 [candidate division Zixibacteria bacterium]